MIDHVVLTPEQEKARKRRNIMLACSVAAFAVLLFFITLSRLQGAAS